MKYEKQIKRGEIYYADLNPVIGSEQGGRRPVLILQNDMGNRHSPTTIVAALTTKADKPYLPTEVAIGTDCLPRPSVVMLSQIRTVDKERLESFIGTVGKETMEKVDRAIVASFGIEYLEGLLL